MRLGSFWGLTAPMLVLAFPDREGPVSFFKIMSQNSNTECLKELQKELVYLTRLESLQSFKVGINVAEMVGVDDRWADGYLIENPEYSNIFKSEILQSVLVKLYEREKRNRFKALDKLQSVLDTEMSSWSGKISEKSKLVNSIISKLSDSDSPEVIAWMQGNSLSLETELVDSVQVGNTIRKISEDEQKICKYYLHRMQDIKYWITLLHTSNVKQEEVWGISFALLAKRKPESIRYAVMNQFEQIKSMNNEKILRDTVKRVATDTVKMRESYSKFVTSKDITVVEGNEVEMSASAQQFYQQLRCKGFSLTSLLKADKQMLSELFEIVNKLSVDTLETSFGFKCNNWNTLGEKISELGICGINQEPLNLFTEAVLNTVLSFDRIYREQEVIDRVYEILDNDVQALLDTIIPIGEVL